jgi:hypothetical protein
MEVPVAGMLGQQVAWVTSHKQCLSDNASSQSSITECIQLDPQHGQQSGQLHGQPQGAVHKLPDHSAADASDATGAQPPQSASVTHSPPGARASDTGSQRVSSRLRKRQRHASGSGEPAVGDHALSAPLPHLDQRYFYDRGQPGC